MGGYVARHVGDIAAVVAVIWQPDRLLVIVFVVSSICRLAVVAGFLPRLEEPRIRRRPHLLEVVVRVVRFNAISGIALDWMSVARKPIAGSEDRLDSES